MRISFDWPQIYDALVSQSSLAPKNAFAAARQIENDIFEEGWQVGEVFGDQAHLIRRYDISRATLRQAARLLEDRRVAHMRRGPGGGLIILAVSGAAIAPAVAAYFRAAGIDAIQIRRARTALHIIEAYRAAFAEGREALRAFTTEFRGQLAQGAGAGLLDPGGWRFAPVKHIAPSHVFTDLFSACLDGIEHPKAASNPPLALRQGLAHSLAHKLMLELPFDRVEAAQRLGTEDQFCERHHVGREVLRQALRVLESRGLIDSQRGRTHGLHAGASDSAALVEQVVAYLSSVRLAWDDFEPVAQILSRIVRIVLVAESTSHQRQQQLRALDSASNRTYSPKMVAAHLHSEWAIAANPLLIFMERCATAYCARSSAAIWKCFDDSAFPSMDLLRQYMVSSAEGDTVKVDRIVDGICGRVRALRVGGEPYVAFDARAVLT